MTVALCPVCRQPVRTAAPSRERRTTLATIDRHDRPGHPGACCPGVRLVIGARWSGGPA